MTDIQIDAGTLTASVEDRTVTGLLVPFGEEARSNLGRFTVDTGAFSIPADHSVVGFNLEHAREDVLGRATNVRETPEGIVATFSVAKTPEGDQALADISSGQRTHLSAEVANVVIKAGKAVGGRLFGGALVAKPAFPSATLLAAAEDTPEAISVDLNVEQLKTQLEPYGLTVAPLGDDTPEVAPGDESKPLEIIDPDKEPEETETDVPNATVPATLNASERDANASVNKETLLANIAGAARTQDRTLIAALSDVKISGANAVGTNVVVPEYVGEVWGGRTFQRRVIPLITQGSLTSLTTKGWRFTTPPEVGEWAGNKAEIPSNVAKTEAVEWGVTRFAGGWDIAREFFDFGETAVIDSFLRAAADSYAKKSDAKVLNDLVLGATSGTVGVIPAGVSDAMAKIVRGALRVINSDALPSFAIVASDVFEQLVFTREEDKLAYLNAALGLEEGTVSSFKVVPHPGMVAGTVLVGAKEAAGAYELPGAPIRVNAIDIVHGGLDEALFGYIQTRIEYPTGLQLIKPNA
ncbi:hypothetical protein ABID81_002968 [Frigoribacterium sp. PvP054]|uniref:phage major capsid protein n=1 Tax=Frigoribacterium sp. PvP054 TaxID=3156438 RepID=UPI00339AAAF1